jgi:hypothetical protein
MFAVPSATFRLWFLMLILVHDRVKIARFDVTQLSLGTFVSQNAANARISRMLSHFSPPWRLGCG